MRNASSADSGGADMKLPPSASPGAKAIACRAPSSAAPARVELAAQRLEVLRAVHVQLEHVRRVGQPRGRALGHPARAAEAGEHDLGARALRALGDRVGDAALASARP